MTRSRYFVILRRHWVTISIFLLAGAVGGAVWAGLTPPTFETRGEVQLTVTVPSTESSDLATAATVSRQLAITYAVTAESNSITGPAFSVCTDGDTVPRVRAFAVQGTSIVRFLVQGEQSACTTAFSAELVDLLVSKITSDQQESGAKVSAAVIDTPADNLQNNRPSPIFNIAIGLLFGLAVGLLVTFQMESHHDSRDENKAPH